MKIAKRSADSGEFRPGPSTGISAENYVDRAKSFIHGNGGSGFVIRAIEGSNGSAATKQPATEAQWIAWIEYFEAKGIPHRYLEANGMATVPGEWPEFFDAAAQFSDQTRTLERAPLSNRLTPETAP